MCGCERWEKVYGIKSVKMSKLWCQYRSRGWVRYIFCKYCGYKILLDGQSDEIYEAKVEAKKIESEERIENSKIQLKKAEAYAEAEKEKSNNKVIIFLFIIMLGLVFLPLVFSKLSSNDDAKQEASLQQIINDVNADIQNKDFANAYIKASQIKFENGGEDKTNKWEETRKNVVAQIEAAEKAETGKSTNPDRKWYQKIFD